MNAESIEQSHPATVADTALTSSPSLRIAVVGLGGIGSAFAFHLARFGRHAVTAVARSNSVRFEQLQRDEGIIDDKGQHATMDVADRLQEDIPYDLVIITMPAHRVDAILPGLKRSAAKSILFMFNNFEPERLRDAIGADRCSFGMPFIQAYIDGDGKLRATIGAGGQKNKMDHPGWVDVFIGAGLPSVFEPKMLLWLRCHVPLCIAFESVSVAGMRRGGGASWGEAMMLARGVQESFTLIKRLGFPIYPAGKVRLNASPAWVVAAMLWSMSRIRSFRELLATGLEECRALVDVLLESAAQADISVSLAMIQAMKPLPNDPSSPAVKAQN